MADWLLRLKLTIAYDGTAYQGWQAQETPRQPLTIQGELEKAVSRVVSMPCRITGAGRTDSGVHALGQVAHVDVPEKTLDWRHCLNAILPPDIRILEAVPVAADFHARSCAIAKTYIYHFWQEQGFLPPERRSFVWNCGPLNVAQARSALPLFLGEHDFASFRNAGSDVKTTVRKILAIDLHEEARRPFLPAHLPALTLQITGTGFLKQMVRNIAGFLAAVGRGKAAGPDLPAILKACDRRRLPSATAPAKGLFLAKIWYNAPEKE